jgi:hypothetical protein
VPTMTAHESPARRLAGIYTSELRLTLRNNSGAFSYSVMITCTLAMVSAVQAPPEPGQILLFLVGAVVSFAVIETLATRGFTRGLTDEEAPDVVALGASISLVSIALAVAAAWLVAAVLPETLSWPAAALVASTTYLLLSGAEMVLARRIEEARGAARSGR